RFVKHTRKAKKVYLGLMKVMKGRTGRDKAALRDAQEKLVKITGEAIAGGREIQAELESLQEKSSLANRLRGQLDEWIEATEKVVRQTQEVIKGNRRLPRRLVSLFDTDARPIKRGKARADTEFGRKVLLGETDHGIITTYDVLEENPADTTLLKSVVKGHRRLFRKRLKVVAADRGFYSQANEDWLKDSGVKRVSIPKRGKVGEERRSYQKQSWFKRLQRFRAGIEGRISLLKRKFGLKRSRVRGNSGTNTWVGQSVFAHNLWQAARIG
ncbi:transposase, partial [Chloroflexota bacterium]